MPEAEVYLGTLNVGFGDVGYRGVKELKAACIGRGGRHTAHIRGGNHLTVIFF